MHRASESTLGRQSITDLKEVLCEDSTILKECQAIFVVGPNSMLV